MASLNQSPTEELVAEWTEPTITGPAERKVVSLILVATVGGTMLMAGIGYFLSDATFYFGAIAALVAGIAVAFQKHRPAEPLPISLTTLRIQVGSKEYLLDTLAGFWFTHEATSLVVNIEPAKAALFPISFRYPTQDEEEARALMQNILGEVEPRSESIADTISRYIKL